MSASDDSPRLGQAGDPATACLSLMPPIKAHGLTLTEQSCTRTEGHEGDHRNERAVWRRLPGDR